MGCHETEKKANSQIAALNASEESALQAAGADEFEIIGVRGGTDFLVEAGRGDGLGQVNVPLGRIFSLDTGGWLGERLPITSIAVRGYWEDASTVPEGLLDDVRAKIGAL